MKLIYLDHDAEVLIVIEIVNFQLGWRICTQSFSCILDCLKHTERALWNANEILIDLVLTFELTGYLLHHGVVQVSSTKILIRFREKNGRLFDFTILHL